MAKFRMKLPVVVEVEFTVETEDDDGAYKIVRLTPPNAAAFTRALSGDDSAVSIEAEIETRRLRRRGLIG